MPARGYFLFKELADLFFSLLVLPVELPLIGLVALATLAERDGPVLFRQRRAGYSGRSIEVLKFRTMVPLNPSPPGSTRAPRR